MVELKLSSQFKKDLKRIKHNERKKGLLKKVLWFLRKGEKVPCEYQPHLLEGDYKGCMECHIENDFLLIWIDNTNNSVRLVRLGSHSELFKARKK